LFAVTGAGTLSLAVALLLEPRCIGGPFALVDPAIWPYWQTYVRELQPLFPLFRVNPLTAAAIAAFPAMGLLAVVTLANDGKQRRDYGFLAAAAVFLAALLTTIVAIRGYSYAIWLGMPLVATMALRLFAVLNLTRMVPRVATALMLTPLAVSSGAITVALANGLGDTDSFLRPESRQCIQTASYAPLASLPPGLVVTDISWGPYLLALTPHSVEAAPYHRLGPGIVTAHRALVAPPDQARDILKAAKANYVMICGPRPPDGMLEAERSQSLWAQLRAGAVPGWLQRLPGTGSFAVYRIMP
jgi:hypothetical protein